MLTDAGVRMVLTGDALRGDFSEHSDRNLGPRADGGSLAYVIYTSGSTGMPKGVEIPQRAIARLVFESRFAEMSSRERILKLATVFFDAATVEFWGAILTGVITE